MADRPLPLRFSTNGAPLGGHGFLIGDQLVPVDGVAFYGEPGVVHLTGSFTLVR